MIESQKDRWGMLPANRMLLLLESRKKDIINGINKYEHSLQAATRAFEDKRDSEYVVMCLFHDLLGGISPDNHARAVAELLRPYLSKENYFILYHHDRFQYNNWTGKKHETITALDEKTIEFCDNYDFPSFDTDYPTLPIEIFRPLVYEVISGHTL